MSIGVKRNQYGGGGSSAQTVIDSTGQLSSGYSLSGNAAQDTTGVRFTRPSGTQSNMGYILGVDFTNVNTMVMSYTSTSSVYIRLNGNTLATITPGSSGVLNLDVSQYSGIIPIEVVVNNYANILLTYCAIS